MYSICGTDCCENCSRKEECGGCAETKGHPFGGTCTAAEYIKREGFDVLGNLKKSWFRNSILWGLKILR